MVNGSSQYNDLYFSFKESTQEINLNSISIGGFGYRLDQFTGKLANLKFVYGDGTKLLIQPNPNRPDLFSPKPQNVNAITAIQREEEITSVPEPSLIIGFVIVGGFIVGSRRKV